MFDLAKENNKKLQMNRVHSHSSHSQINTSIENENNEINKLFSLYYTEANYSFEVENFRLWNLNTFREWKLFGLYRCYCACHDSRKSRMFGQQEKKKPVAKHMLPWYAYA